MKIELTLEEAKTLVQGKLRLAVARKMYALTAGLLSERQDECNKSIQEYQGEIRNGDPNIKDACRDAVVQEAFQAATQLLSKSVIAGTDKDDFGKFLEARIDQLTSMVCDKVLANLVVGLNSEQAA